MSDTVLYQQADTMKYEETEDIPKIMYLSNSNILRKMCDTLSASWYYEDTVDIPKIINLSNSKL